MVSKERMAEVISSELEAAIQLAQAANTLPGGGAGGMMQAALAYYEGVLPENDDPNGDSARSAVSLDVGDMVEAVYAQLAPTLSDAGGVEFEAVSAEDEPRAQEETAIVRAMLMEGHSGEGGFMALTESIKDCLLMRTGVLACWIDRRETRTPEEWEAVPELGIAAIVEPTTEGERIERLTIAVDEDAPQGEGQQQLFRVKFDRVTVDKRLCVGAIAPENMVTSSPEERDPNRARFVADRMLTTRARLVAEGFPEADVRRLKAHDPTTYELYVPRTPGVTDGQDKAVQVATETVEVWRCYVMLADDESGLSASRYRVYFGRDGKVILGQPERVGWACYAVGNVTIFPHRMAGVSLFDRLGETQQLKTSALRSWVENLRKVNRPRLGIDESLANLADARDATQDVIRIKGPGAILPIPVVDAGPSVLAFLQYQDQCRSERGGAALDMQSSAAQIATNQTAQGIERQYSVKEQLAAMMARTFAETCVRSAFVVAHYLLRTSWGGTLHTKIGGSWKQADPSKWRPRTGVLVRVGESRSERMAKAAALQTVLQAQAAMMQAGKTGILTDDAKMFNAAHDWIAAAQLRNPERYLIDPSSLQAQQAAQAQQEQAQAALQAQADAARAALMLEKYKVDVQGLTDMISQLVKAAIEEAKMTLSTAPIDRAQAQTEVAAQGAAQAAASDTP